MTKPTIHLNGTDRKTLAEAYKRAYEALTNAMNAVQDTAPHGRDYYPQGETIITKAIEEHCQRMGTLNAIRDEIFDLFTSTESL